MGVMVVIGVIGLIFESDEDKAVRVDQELADEQDKITAKQKLADMKAEKQAAKDKLAADEQAAKDKKNATSKVMLVTTCQLAIKPQLKNPKSMKLDWHQTAMAEMSTGQLGVRMYYYAENSFGATPLSIVNCLFDTDGNLLEYKQVQ